MDARELKDQASDLFRRGKFAKAAESYVALIKLEPKELQHNVKLGDSYRRDGQKDKAIEAYRDAVDGYAKQGVMIKAIATCKLILEIDPAHKRAQEALAQLCAQRYARPSEPAQPLPPPRSKTEPPAAKGRKPLPESIDLPDEEESLEIEGQDNRKETSRPLPPIKHEAQKPPPPPPKPPPVVAKPPASALMAQVQTPESDELELDLSGDAGEIGHAPPPSPVEFGMTEEAHVAVELDLPGRAQEVENIELPNVVAATATEVEVDFTGGDDSTLDQLEVIEEEEMPPRISIMAQTTGEHEVMRTVASAASAPTTAMAAILASSQDVSDEIELFSVTTGSQTGRIHTIPPAPAGVLDDLLQATAVQDLEAVHSRTQSYSKTGPQSTQQTGRHSISAEDHQAAQLAEDAAFDLVSAHDEPEPETVVAPEPPPPAIPTGDLNQENVPLFSELPKDAFIDLLELLTFRRVAAGEPIVREGDVGKSIYILASGHARVVKGQGTPSPIELATLDEGAFFGEMALLNGAPRVASVVAAGECEVLELTEAILRDLTKKHPSVGESLRRFYRQRLLANVMAMSPLFRAFDKGDKKTLVEKFKLREVQNGEQVIKEGQAPDGLYVVMHGAALVTKHDLPNSREVPLAVLKEGDVFGEMSLLTRKPAVATVTAKRKTLMLRLPKVAFDELKFTHPAILEVVSELSEIRSRTNEQILSGDIDAPREVLAFV